MLNIFGSADLRTNHCDRLSRRDFIRVGGMAAGGLSLAQLLAIEGRAGSGSSTKSIINVFLPGGPSHIDFFDLKPNAPAEIRGEFSPIKTNVPGMEICELFPRLAKLGDKYTIIRSVVGSEGHHDGFQCMTGRTHREPPPAGGWPMYGAWVSKTLGPREPSIPANVSLMYPTGHKEWGDPYRAGFIGPAHDPMALLAKDPLARATGMTLQGISLEQLDDRRRLLRSMDAFRGQLDNYTAMVGSDTFSEQAFSILTSSKLAEALDLSREDPATLERYGKNDPTYQRDGAPRMIRNFLVARRLVEAGARVVSMNYSRWDWHGGDGMNFPSSRVEFPLLDQGLSALITDLHDRGMDKDVTVVVWGEFGRTPKINKNNSRDHWPQVSFAMMFGGGNRHGQVIGATNKFGEYATERPVTFQEVFATLYHNVGIDTQAVTVDDLNGRPQYLLDSNARPISELV